MPWLKIGNPASDVCVCWGGCRFEQALAGLESLATGWTTMLTHRACNLLASQRWCQKCQSHAVTFGRIAQTCAGKPGDGFRTSGCAEASFSLFVCRFRSVSKCHPHTPLYSCSVDVCFDSHAFSDSLYVAGCAVEVHPFRSLVARQ